MRRKDRDSNSSPKRKSHKNTRNKITAKVDIKNSTVKQDKEFPVFPLSEGLIVVPMLKENNRCRFGCIHS